MNSRAWISQSRTFKKEELEMKKETVFWVKSLTSVSPNKEKEIGKML